MFKLRNISIRSKLVAMQVFTSLIVVIIFFLVYVLTDFRDYKQRKVNSVLGLAQVIGANSVSTLEFQDNDEARNILLELRKVSPEVVYAAILDKDENIFASYTRPGKDSFQLPSSMKGKEYDFGKDDLFIKKAIINGGARVGYVILEVELTELELIKQSKYKLAYLLLLASVGLSLLVGFVIQPYISKRLFALVNRMKEVSETGNYSNPLVDESGDEISSLVKNFNEMMYKLKESEKKKDEFIGIASHELKTPLTSIKGYLELLHELEDKQPNKQFVQKAKENVDKLQQLVKDLLDVSKIQSGQLQLSMDEFNIDQVIDEMIASFKMITTSHEIIKENQSDITLWGDRQRIEQVLVNLVSNAIKYSPGQNKVMISCKNGGSELTIRVRDYGIGIPAEEHENVFKRFYRPKEISVHISGFGLGLYICRDIVERHHGRIWIGAEEKGTSFYFSLPLNKPIKEKEN